MLSACLALADPSSTTEAAAPEHLLEQGLQSFRHGAFADAVVSWREAAQVYEREGKPHEQSDVLNHLAQAYQALGQYTEALKSLDVALALAKKVGDRAQMASVLGSLGNTYLAVGSADTASQYLQEGLGITRELGDERLSALLLNDLGNLFTAQKRYSEALDAYRESVSLAQKTANRALAARVLTNMAVATLRNGQSQESKALLDRALDQMRSLDHSHDTAYGLINIGLAYADLRPQLPDSSAVLSGLASQALTETASVAEDIGDLRAASYAWGYLGKLYEDEGRQEEALELTRKAVFAAQQVNAPESLYRWQWQIGRLLKALKNPADAIAAYRRAVETLQSIRQGMVTRSASAPSSFRESVGPVYFGLVDLLLQQAAATQDPERRNADLQEARQTVESLKVAELRDYFQDDCVDAVRAKTRKLDEVVSRTVAVVYPILLPDRTELLISLPTGLKSIAVPVGATTLTQQVRELRRTVVKRTTQEYLPYAQQLYNWLIRPLEPDLTAFPINTLVFVPDGPLRTIPMAVLHDGKQFLISKYTLATTPGLELTDPRPLPRTHTTVLAAGLSEAVQGFPPLPYVTTELQAIQHLYAGNVLLNQAFLTASVEKELREEPFTIVHIASHGQFDSDVKKTFVLTFDDRLTLDRLDQFVGLFRFRDDPLELLTLSACETAAGDDRAALGLAGVAVKAGARSALATLWRIQDEAAAILIGEFYRQLQDPAVSRAVALQRAQAKLLQDGRYQHPGYWSPFLLINNWL